MKIALFLKTEFSNRECRANPNVCVFMCLHIPTYTHNLTNAHTYLCMCAKSLQLYPTLWDSMDCSPPGSSVHGVLQAGVLEWVPISFSRGSSRPRDWTCVSCTGKQILYSWATREALSLAITIFLKATKKVFTQGLSCVKYFIAFTTWNHRQKKKKKIFLTD